MTYTINVKNNGPDPAQSIAVADPLPGAVTFVSCSSTLGGICVGSTTAPGVTLATLAPDATETITIKVKVNGGIASGTSFLNTSTAGALSPPDPNLADNTATASVIVLNRADLSVNTSKSKSTSRQIEYTLTVVNNGPYDARGLVLTDVLPQGTVFGSLVPGPWSCTAPGVGATGIVKCTLDNLPSTPPGSASATTALTVKVTVNGSTTITNVANVTSVTFDPDTSNNSIVFKNRFGNGK